MPKFDARQAGAAMRAGARFQPQAISQQVEDSFNRSLSSKNPAAGDAAGAGKPGVVTRTMGFSEARGHLAEDGAKRHVGPRQYTITEANKKSNAGGSDILTAEFDEHGKLIISSTDVKSLQRGGNVTKVSAHEEKHLQKSLGRVAKQAGKMAKDESLPQHEREFHQQVHDTLKVILRNTAQAIRDGTLKLAVNNTGGNSSGVKVEHHDFQDTRTFAEPEEGAAAGTKVPIPVKFDRHGVSNAVKEKYGLGGEPDYHRDISGEKQKERTAAERDAAREGHPPGTVKPLRFLPTAIKLIKGIADRATSGVTERAKGVGAPAQPAPGEARVDGATSAGAPPPAGTPMPATIMPATVQPAQVPGQVSAAFSAKG